MWTERLWYDVITSCWMPIYGKFLHRDGEFMLKGIYYYK